MNTLQIFQNLRDKKPTQLNDIIYNLGMLYKTDDKTFYDDFAVILFEMEKYRDSYNISKKCYTYDWDEDNLERLRANQSYCLEHIKEEYSGYNKERVNELTNIFQKNRLYPPDGLSSTTITMTSCKRFDLFEKTVNSFINCCLDIATINDWIVIDDNSSEEDRNKMKTLYPFITFIMKTENEKGHPNSMNRLIKMVKTKYVFHLEDDWLFINKDNYITKCINGINSNSVGQCLLNLNYSENLQCYNIRGAKELKINNDRYYTHTYLQNNELLEYNKKGYKNCVYWPHYSFRVGLTKTSIFKELGEYDTKGHFEMEYAKRYSEKGYKTLFLDNLNCIHIGRNTWERNDTSKNNAYTLNKENQFQLGEPKKESKYELKHIPINTRRKSIELKVVETIQEQKHPQLNLITQVVNLERRDDRKLKFIEDNHSQLQQLQYTFFSAVDGKKLEPSHKLSKLFETNDYHYRRGIVGCALSHLKLWCLFLADQSKDLLLVLEDDITLADNFIGKMSNSLKNLPFKDNKPDWDILFLGHFLYPHLRKDEDKSNSVPRVEEWSRDRRIKESMGGTIGYVITKQGAKNLITHIHKNSIYNGIDWVMFKSPSRIFYCYPHIVYSECLTDTIKPDSDIQYDMDNGLEESSDVWLKRDIEYWLKEYEGTKNEQSENKGTENKNKGIRYQHCLNQIPEYEDDEKSRVVYTEKYLPQKDILLLGTTIIKINDEELVLKYIQDLSKFPVQYYTIRKDYLVVVSIAKINEKIQKDITLGGFLNLINPIP